VVFAAIFAMAFAVRQRIGNAAAIISKNMQTSAIGIGRRGNVPNT
jgi:hypothetical protein